MKLKCRPEDFRVQELLDLKLRRAGRYSVYRLVKRGWNTLDVVRQLEKRHGLRGIARAGLKDRHSRSVQFISARGRGPESIVEPDYRLTRVGMSQEPVSRARLVGNRFSIVMRALTGEEADLVRRRIPELSRYGTPNYYDDQRFGSARHNKGFIARRLIAGHYNGALKLYLATPSAADESRTRRLRQHLADHWGDWRRCAGLAPTEERRIFRHLAAHPRDHLGAVKLIRRDLLEIFINAYQSYVWNETMVGLLERLGVPTRTVRYSVGTLRFYERLAPNQLRYLRRLTIPAPGQKARFSSDRVAGIVERVLERDGLRLQDVKLPFRIRGLFFKPYERSALLTPTGIRASPPQPDDLYPGRSKLRLSFTLPPGAYATIVVKRLYHV